MKPTILLLAFFVAALSSCTSAYKSVQTPDDVYFSPAQPQDEYVQTEQRNNRRYYSDDEYYGDRYLRMKVQNRYQWNDLNDWYSYERYGFIQNYYYGSYYNPYNSWNYYYNPYGYCYGNIAYSNPKVIAYKAPVKPRSFNIAGYNNTNYNNTNTGSRSIFKNSKNQPAYNNTNNNNNSGRGLSNTIRTIFSNSNSNSNSGNNNSSRTYSPSNSSQGSSSGSSSGSSNSGGSRPTRGGNN